MECCWKNRYAAARHYLQYRNRFLGAGEGIRTPDPLITNQMLYQLSYASSQRSALPSRTYPLIPS